MCATQRATHRRAINFCRSLLLSWAVAAPAALAQPAAPLGFDEALRLAVAESPRLAAQTHAVEAARAAVVPAGELPDPKLTLGVDNVPIDGPERWSLSRDFMTMRRIGVMQEFPRAEKRRLRETLAEAQAGKEKAALANQSSTVRQEAALAWLDAWFAQAQVRTLAELEPEAALLQDAARAQVAGGTGTATDAIAAQAARVLLQDRLSDAHRNAQRAQAMLARWLGPAAQRPLAAPPDFNALALSPERLLAGIEHHPELAEYGPMEAMARAEADLARAAKKADWSLEMAYQQRGGGYADMVSVAVRVDLPLWGEKRQDPLIVARQKQLEQVQAEREDARRLHTAQVQGEIAAWEAGKERVARIQQALLPLAKERTQAAIAAYRGGRGDLDAVLQARSNEIETRLMALQQEAELGRAWAALNFLTGNHTELDTQ